VKVGLNKTLDCLGLYCPKPAYVQTSGADTPERAYAPFMLVKTAAMMNIGATIYFLIKEVMDQSIKAGVKLLVGEQSCPVQVIPREGSFPNAKIVGAADLNDLILKANAVRCF